MYFKQHPEDARAPYPVLAPVLLVDHTESVHLSVAQILVARCSPPYQLPLLTHQLAYHPVFLPPSSHLARLAASLPKNAPPVVVQGAAPSIDHVYPEILSGYYALLASVHRLNLP